MQILINTDKNVTAGENFSAELSEMVEKGLNRFASHVTRVEMHIGDENGHKSGQNDKRCMLEVRPEGMKPIAVTSHGDTYQQAVRAAVDKMKGSLDSIIGKLRAH